MRILTDFADHGRHVVYMRDRQPLVQLAHGSGNGVAEFDWLI